MPLLVETRTDLAQLGSLSKLLGLQLENTHKILLGVEKMNEFNVDSTYYRGSDICLFLPLLLDSTRYLTLSVLPS